MSRTHPDKLKVKTARVVFPAVKELPMASQGGSTHIQLPKLERYAVVRLGLA
jgi:hypothetical protein